MFGHTHNNDMMYTFSPEFLAVPESMASLPPPDATADYFPPPPPLVIPSYEFEPVYATSSEGYDSPSYVASPSMVIQRSGSSQFQNNEFFNQPVSSPTELLDSEGNSSTTVTRAFSAGDSQGTNKYHRSESPLSSESNSIIESMNKLASPYSPDEKRERIERYRSKKTQRNFTKKIKYVCRKTLADSRPRIRGRFARNDEIEKTIGHQCMSQGGEEGFEEDEGYNWNHFLDSLPSNLIP